MLTSDAKSEIEGVRWVLIRRSVLGILFMAVMTLGTLRYATYVTQERKKKAEKQREREAAEEAALKRGGAREKGGPGDEAALALAATGAG